MTSLSPSRAPLSKHGNRTLIQAIQTTATLKYQWHLTIKVYEYHQTVKDIKTRGFTKVGIDSNCRTLRLTTYNHCLPRKDAAADELFVMYLLSKYQHKCVMNSRAIITKSPVHANVLTTWYVYIILLKCLKHWKIEALYIAVPMFRALTRRL